MLLKSLCLNCFFKKHIYTVNQSQQYLPASQLHPLFLVKYSLNIPLLFPASPPSLQWRVSGGSSLPLHSFSPLFRQYQKCYVPSCHFLQRQWHSSFVQHEGMLSAGGRGKERFLCNNFPYKSSHTSSAVELSVAVFCKVLCAEEHPCGISWASETSAALWFLKSFTGK